jgi:hypothetical protein
MDFEFKRTHIPPLAGWTMSTVFGVALAKGWFQWVPDGILWIGFVGSTLLWIYWFSTHELAKHPAVKPVAFVLLVNLLVCIVGRYSLETMPTYTATPFSGSIIASWSTFTKKSPENVQILEVSPRKVVFSGLLPGPIQYQLPQTYTFRLTNISDRILYSVSFKLRVYSTEVTRDDFEVHLASGSRKPVGDQGIGAQRLADVQAFLAGDSKDRPLFLFFMPRLGGHDFREVTLTCTKIGKAIVTGEPDYFTTEPMPQSTQGPNVTSSFNSKEPLLKNWCWIVLFADITKDAEMGRCKP